MDHWFEKCKKTEDIMEFVEDGVLTTTNISKAWLMTHVDSNLECWIHGQKWVKDYLEIILGRTIEYYSRYLINKFHIESLMKAYGVFIDRLAPLYNPLSKECVGVSEETIKYLEGELGISLSDVDFGDLYTGIVESYSPLNDILLEMKHTDYTFFYMCQE